MLGNSNKCQLSNIAQRILNIRMFSYMFLRAILFFTVIVPIQTVEALLTKHTITVDAGNDGGIGFGGTIKPSGDVSVVHLRDKTFIIKPDPGCFIRRITVDGEDIDIRNNPDFKQSGTAGRYTFRRVTTDHTISAEFDHMLKLSILKSGYGTVRSVGKGINCGSQCEKEYSGGSVTLKAQAGNGFSFAGWSGGCEGTSETCMVTMDDDKIVTALFISTTASIDVTPSTSTIKPCGAEYFTASLRTSSGSKVSGTTYEWNIGDDSIAYLYGGAEEKVWVVGKSIGTTQLSVTAGGVTETAYLSVDENALRPSEISWIYPVQGSMISTRTPVIKVFVDLLRCAGELSGTGDVEGVLHLDGVAIPVVPTHKCTDIIDPPYSRTLCFKSSSRLSTGLHEARIDATTYLGETITYAWTFEIQ